MCSLRNVSENDNSASKSKINIYTKLCLSSYISNTHTYVIAVLYYGSDEEFSREYVCAATV